ncbi:MAG: DUF488 domain-containing protein [Planctomycetota bacterium]|jgi:uncharacterized protein (DUF488 family)
MSGHDNERKINIFTIGFAGKSASEFFTKLKDAGVKRVIDVRLNNVSQLAGFTKKRDIEYFLREIGGIEYIHRPEFAPTKSILDTYKKKEIDWSEYERQFHELMLDRQIENRITGEQVNNACFLCSEAEPENCHRRLVVEYLQNHWPDAFIHHL